MNTLYNNAGYSEAATWIGFEGKEVIGSPDLSNDLSKSAILIEKSAPRSDWWIRGTLYWIPMKWHPEGDVRDAVSEGRRGALVEMLNI